MNVVPPDQDHALASSQVPRSPRARSVMAFVAAVALLVGGVGCFVVGLDLPFVLLLICGAFAVHSLLPANLPSCGRVYGHERAVCTQPVP